MIVNNIKIQLFYLQSITQSVREISFILNIFYVHDLIELKFSMIVKTKIFYDCKQYQDATFLFTVTHSVSPGN